MAQIRESQFAIFNRAGEDIDLFDLYSSGIVTVETEHEYYDEDLDSQIEDLDEGDIIEAQIQGEDILQPNAIWRFLEFQVIGHDQEWIWNR